MKALGALDTDFILAETRQLSHGLDRFLHRGKKSRSFFCLQKGQLTSKLQGQSLSRMAIMLDRLLNTLSVSKSFK